MWFFRQPSPQRIASYLAEQAQLPFSYPHVGASDREGAPPGYDLDHNRIQLGTGQAVFDAASAALRRWQQFPAPWTRIVPADIPIAVGNAVAMLAHVNGLWWLNAARIVYVIEQQRRFGFAYGTLPDHVERGEERFTIEWLPDDTVWYDLRAFSQPRLALLRLAYPLARRQQQRFARESMAAMQRLARGRPA